MNQNVEQHEEPALDTYLQSGSIPGTRMTRNLGDTKAVSGWNQFLKKYGVTFAIAVGIIGFSGGGQILGSLFHHNATTAKPALQVGSSPLPADYNHQIGENVISQANSSQSGIPVGPHGQQVAAISGASAAPVATPTPDNNPNDLNNAISPTPGAGDITTETVTPAPLPPPGSYAPPQSSDTSYQAPQAPQPTNPPIVTAPAADPPSPEPTPGLQPAPGSIFVPAPGQNVAPQDGNSGASMTTYESANTMRASGQAAFLDQQSSPAYMDSKEQAARQRTEIFGGTPAQVVLDDDIISTLPGYVWCHLTAPVKASLPPYDVVFPTGTRCRGVYNSDTAPGDNRMQVRWDLLILPNGTTFALKDMQAQDLNGANGLTAEVDNHVGRVYSSLFIGTLLNIGSALITGGSSALVRPTLGQAAGQGIAQTGTDYASQAVNAHVQQPPTLTVRKGYRFEIKFAATALVQPYRTTHLPPPDHY